MWSANTERFSDRTPGQNSLVGVNDTADNLLKAIENGHEEVAPSTVFAVACILEGVPYINGSPQNTFVPGAIELAERHGAYIGGDDFKSGQTKMKSALVDFMINAGIKLTSIASYNHLGNNDGKNLSSQEQFRSKEISKSNVVDDMVAANNVLYAKGEHPDHTVVIKYMPAVGDDKRAMDEYYAEIFLGGHQMISMTNMCEDSLLAAPLIIDLVLISEVMTRIKWKNAGESDEDFKKFHSVLSILSYMLKVNQSLTSSNPMSDSSIGSFDSTWYTCCQCTRQAACGTDQHFPSLCRTPTRERHDPGAQTLLELNCVAGEYIQVEVVVTNCNLWAAI